MTKARKTAPSAGEESRAEVSVTEAARNFSDLINRVRYRGERFLLTRGGVPVAEVGPVAATRVVAGQALAKRVASMPRLGPDGAAKFAADIDDARSKVAPIGAGPWE